MKLELKHLAAYLPDKLMVLHGDKSKVMNAGQGSSNNWIGINSVVRWQNIKAGCKPMLRPLFDLTKEEYYYVYENETDYESIMFWINMDVESRFCGKYSYYFWELLFENHFDVFGLIEKGLAIDINTLNETK